MPWPRAGTPFRKKQSVAVQIVQGSGLDAGQRIQTLERFTEKIDLARGIWVLRLSTIFLKYTNVFDLPC